MIIYCLFLVISYVLHCRANIEDVTFDFITYIPKLDFKGKYNLKVKVSIFDLSGKGDVRGAFCKYI